MGTIKLKKTSTETEQLETIVSGSIFENAAAETEKRRYDDPAVLKEFSDKADAISRHYKLNNGTAKSIISASPSNYFDEFEQKWKAIDNSLSETAHGYESSCGKYKAVISKPEQSKSVKMTASGLEISWTYLGKQPASAQKATTFAAEEPVATSLNVEASIQGALQSKGSRAVYQNADRDIDIEYRLSGNNVKENIIVKEKAEEYRYLFALNTQGLKLRISEDNASLELYSEVTGADGSVQEKVEATIPAPFMYDANGESSDDVYFELAPETEGKYTFAVIASEEWINAENRAFPVIIDPQIVTESTSAISGNVQYRYIYSSSSGGSGSGSSSWTNIKSDYIKVVKTISQEYHTILTVNKNNIKTLDQKISSVKLILTPYRVAQPGRCRIGETDFNVSIGTPVTVNITSRFNSSSGSFTINVEPTASYVNAEFYLKETNGPVIEVEYLLEGQRKRTIQQFTLAGGLVGQYDVATGDMSVAFEDVPAADSVLGVGISHVYKKSAEEFHVGENFRLSLNETLVKNADAALDAEYVYTDQNGMKHGFKDTYYYINESGKKTSVNKSLVTVDLDGKLTYTTGGKTYEVNKEQRTRSGLSITTRYEDFKGVDWLEQRSDEQKQLEQQKKSYFDALKQFVIVETNSDEIKYYLKDFLPNNFSQFMASIEEDKYILLTESEAFNFYSMILQRDSLNTQRDNYEQQQNALDHSKDALYYQYQTMCNTKELDPDDDSAKNTYENVTLQNNLNQESRDNLWQQYLDVNASKTNLTISFLQSQDQLNLLESQLKVLYEKSSDYEEQVREYYKEYLNLDNRIKQMNRQLPANYLTDGQIIKGFNENGWLVAIFDKYDNVMSIEYDENGKILAVNEGENKQIVFEYRPDGLLGSITDTRGRRTVYDYESTKIKVLRPDGTVYEITFSGDEFTGVKVYENAKQQEDSKPIGISTVSKKENKTTVTNMMGVSSVENGKINYLASSAWKTLNTLEITFGSGLTTVSEVESEKNTYYRITDEDKVYAYYVEENNQVTTAELYDYEAYDRDNTQQAKRSSLYTKPYSSFSGDDFVGGDSVNTVLDEFNNPSTKTTNARALSDGTTQEATVTYDYDDNHKCIKESAVVTITKSSGNPDIHTYITAYNYNAAGNIVRKESYIQGEEYTTGKSIEETVYDEKGNVVKSFTYNSLDSSSKFYTESEYAENGQVTADLDETGENKTEYEYISGTNVVRSQKLPNGSKFAYGHDENDTVTSITQSTEEGEENSTHTRYTCGEVTELVSGNNKVNYAYDAKRRLSKVKLNDADYVTITTTEATNKAVETAKITFIARNNDGKSDYYEVTKNKRGDVLSVKYTYSATEPESSDYAELYTKVYDAKSHVVQITQGAATLESNEYDDYDRQTKHTFGAHVHETEYNGYGQTSKDIIKFGNSTTDKLEYAYAYDDEKASRPMTDMTVGGFGENYEQDVSGRSAKLTQTLGGNTYTKRYGYYKQGDHATNRVNTVYYGKNGVTDGKVTYTYDGMGNIISVNENGKQRYKYAYDKIGRIISETDLYKNKEICYTYDNNGNILTKNIDGEVTEYRYKEGTDQLVSFGTESIAYDNMGNPITYKGMACTWEKGRQLASISDGTNRIEYEYDVFGIRTAKKIYAPKEATEPTQTTSYVYENGKLLRQITDDEVMTFVYGSEGVIGFTLSGSTEVSNGNYLYRKNLFGDITGIINESGALVYEYTYSAFGKSDKEEETGIGEKNPFRYRGYYYDDETGLYYLKSRYYDPETGRFITIDDVSYIDPETINGLNLYAYCGNNPVMGYDPEGTWDWGIFSTIILAILSVSAIIAGAILTITGIGAPLGAILLGAGIGGVVGLAGNVISQGNSKGWNNINWGQVAFNGAIGLITGALMSSPLGAVATGVITGSLGLVQSIGNDLFENNGDWSSVNWIKAITSGFATGLSVGVGKWFINNTSLMNKFINKLSSVNSLGEQSLLLGLAGRGTYISFWMNVIIGQTLYKGITTLISSLIRSLLRWGVDKIFT